MQSHFVRKVQATLGDSGALSGETIVVGAVMESSNATGVNGNQADNSAQESGAAYIFVRNGTTWIQQAYLKASNTAYVDDFGYSVAVSGDTVVVGARSEDSNATEVNGDGSDNSASLSGAAYIFTGFGVGTRLALVPDVRGGYILRFKGIPDVTYRVQRAPSVTGPWDTIATETAPASGIVEHDNASPPPSQAFYRTVQP